MPIQGLPYFGTDFAGQQERMAEGASLRKLREQQGALYEAQTARQPGLVDIQRQNLFTKKLDQVGKLIEQRQFGPAQRFIDEDPELSSRLGKLDIAEAGGGFKVTTQGGVTIVSDASGDWKIASPPKPQRGMVVEGPGGPEVVDPGYRGPLGRKPERVTVGELQGVVLNKFLAGGRKALSVNEQAVVDKMLLDPDVGLALKLLDKDYRFLMADAPSKAKLIGETVRNVKEGRAPSEIPTAEAAPGAPPASPVPTSEKRALYEGLRQQGFTDEDLRGYGVQIPE